jgi:SpoVK/Ycf46/Vps4 family AAA+-type ATPase
MNLSYIDSDSELFQAFANVPANSIVVFEDVDTMSTSLHRRNAAAASQSPQEINNHAVGSEESANAAVTRKFNLSTFLSVLDGHTLEDGIIFIMTTNHQERLDPAIIRPGRMDIHLDLRYATYYQMRRIYKMVIDQEDDESSLDGIYPNLEKEIKEFVVPPSEIMQVMVLCRSKKNRMEIPRKIIQLNEKYNNKN